MYQKRASLSLSVNAIVILILAIVMLGLGMAFIRGMFGQVSDTFEQKISEEPEPVAPNVRNPITISREHIITHSDEVEVLKVALFNPTNQSWTGAEPDITCSGLTTTVDANAKTVGTSEAESFTISVQPSGPAKTYLCVLNISTTTGDASAYQKDITIEIKT